MSCFTTAGQDRRGGEAGERSCSAELAGVEPFAHRSVLQRGAGLTGRLQRLLMTILVDGNRQQDAQAIDKVRRQERVPTILFGKSGACLAFRTGEIVGI